MASMQVQEETASTMLQNEDRAVVEQMMKEAESVLLSVTPNINKVQLQIAGCVLNITKDSHRLHIHNKHDWCGQLNGRASFPPEIPIGGTAKFVHNGAPPLGSKAAMVYASSHTLWLLAWFVPLDDKPNKVYVEDGPKEKYNTIDWDEIQRKLDASGNTSCYEDPITGSKAIAEISSHGKKAKLGAMFLS